MLDFIITLFWLFVILIVASIIWGVISGAYGKQNNSTYLSGRNKKKSVQISLADVDYMNGHEFEFYVAELLKIQGFSNVEVTRGSGDFGVDIVAEKGGLDYAIQTKRQKAKVSRRAISDAVAGATHYGCHRAMVITNSYFSEQGLDFADSLECKIIDRDELKKWVAKKEQDENFDAEETTLDKQKENEYRSEETTTIMETDMGNIDTSGVPDEVVKAIKKFAESEHPNDYSTQAYVIEEELEAYMKIKNLDASDVPEEVLSFIKKKAISESPNEYTMQIYTIEEELEAYRKIKDL